MTFTLYEMGSLWGVELGRGKRAETEAGRSGMAWEAAMEGWEVTGSWLCFEVGLLGFALTWVCLPCTHTGGQVGKATVKPLTIGTPRAGDGWTWLSAHGQVRLMV